MLSLLLQVNPVTFAHSPEEYLVAVGLQPTKPLSDLKTELQDPAMDQAAASEAAAAEMPDFSGARVSTEGSHVHLASSSGPQPQEQVLTALQAQQPQAQRWLTLPFDHLPGVKAEPPTQTPIDVSTDSKLQPVGKQKAMQQSQSMSQTAPGRSQSSNVPWSSPAKLVSLSSLQQQATSQQAPAPRAITVGMSSMPVGSTTGIVGRSWPGQPLYSNSLPAGSSARQGVTSGSGQGEGKGTKRAGGGGDSKRKRQRHGDRERSVEGDQGGAKQSCHSGSRAVPSHLDCAVHAVLVRAEACCDHSCGDLSQL